MALIPTLPHRYHAASIWALYVVGLMPAAWYFFQASTGGLGFNPVKTFEHVIGIWALRLIIVTLAVTPLRDLGGINWVRYRRALGLLAFYYVVIHFAVYLLLDLRLNFAAVGGDIVKRPYITIGFACLLLLIPLAVTSNNWSIRKLGPTWIKLHTLIYLIAAGGALHYVLAVKTVTLVPFIHVALIALLLAYRPLRKPLLKWKRGRKAPARTGVDAPIPNREAALRPAPDHQG
jgi:sulfoxide reductase heme-binding subunit YedZ